MKNTNLVQPYFICLGNCKQIFGNSYPGEEVIIEVHDRLEWALAGLGNHAEGVAVHGANTLEKCK
jgi:hypothetical protein